MLEWVNDRSGDPIQIGGHDRVRERTAIEDAFEFVDDAIAHAGQFVAVRAGDVRRQEDVGQVPECGGGG